MNAHVRPGTADDHEPAAEALALAFADDPAWAHLLPNGVDRAERLLKFFTAEVGNLVPEHRELWVTDDGCGVAIWGRPGRWRVPFRRTLRPLPQLVEVFGRRLGLATWAQLRLERHHPRAPEHWYLHYVAVEPRRQGRGLGAALLAPMLERCDREQSPVHLEASTERNRMLYERHGFAVTGTFPLPGGGPPIREMWRPAAALR
ncbi:MAG: GNAT family N-acetyltransferase [Actinomycetota bacterium]|nr:GNAT family N-acetyltransferase [Actinomycetota bacterium]